MNAALITDVLNYIATHHRENGMYECRKISAGDLAKLTAVPVSHKGCVENLVCYSIVHEKYLLTVSCLLTATTYSSLKVKAVRVA